jgi:hypothetical protein
MMMIITTGTEAYAVQDEIPAKPDKYCYTTSKTLTKIVTQSNVKKIDPALLMTML